MLTINRRALMCAALSMLIGAAAWAQSEGKSDTGKAEAGVAAYIGGKAVTLAEVDAKALETNMKLAQSLYEARQAALDQIIMERLLAAEGVAEGTALDALINERVAGKARPVTDADIEGFYNANKARMGGKSLEEMSGRIRQYLRSQSMNKARQTLLDEMKQKSDVRIMLEPPRVTVVIADNDPAQGPATAKVTIAEYVDFQ
ncbi:MAG: hypothetical protein JSU63_02685 [Phycisphaerales bacterium]|nr:MAG: hypothetical protein JSU63_02685 [Phycisphaerales bacterium]